ncbi:MAG TPA: hypothetical protein VEX37_00555 [Thermomicrobiales bacterium]|nr:hypothetical protein [Thermomicrobiales bacterium]
MERIEQLLAVKTRLTTIKGYAQLLDRDITRMQPRPKRLGVRIDELNHEITRLISLIEDIEMAMTRPIAEPGGPREDRIPPSSPEG